MVVVELESVMQPWSSLMVIVMDIADEPYETLAWDAWGSVAGISCWISSLLRVAWPIWASDNLTLARHFL